MLLKVSNLILLWYPCFFSSAFMSVIIFFSKLSNYSFIFEIDSSFNCFIVFLIVIFLTSIDSLMLPWNYEEIYKFAFIFFNQTDLFSGLIVECSECISDILIVRNCSMLGMHFSVSADTCGTKSGEAFFWSRKTNYHHYKSL